MDQSLFVIPFSSLEKVGLRKNPSSIHIEEKLREVISQHIKAFDPKKVTQEWRFKSISYSSATDKYTVQIEYDKPIKKG